MKNIYKVLVVAFLLITDLCTAGLTGIKTIGTDYPSIKAAITDLNLQGVGAAGVTFNVPATYLETFTAATDGRIVANASFQGVIVFQKSGSGTNPVITSATGSGTMDGIIVLSGVDNITFDGINLIDAATNGNATSQMEWGFALLKNSATDGCNNVIIKNCSISLNSNNVNTVGIYSNDHTFASTALLTVTAIAGTSSNNQFYGNIISNVYNGISLNGFADVSPFTYFDQNNQVGVSGMTANTISNNGTQNSGTVISAGIYTLNQYSAIIANNNINTIGTPSTFAAALSCIYTDAGANVNIDNNIVTLTYSGSGGGTTRRLIQNGGTLGTVTIQNNSCTTMNWTATGGASGSALSFIYNGVACTNLDIVNNTVSNINIPSGNFNPGWFIFNAGSVTTSLQIHNNNIYNNTGSAFRGINSTCSSTPSVYEIFNNNIYNNTVISGYLIGIFIQGSAGATVYNNTIHDNTNGSTAQTVAINSGATVTAESIHDNTIRNLFATSTSTVAGITLSGSVSGTVFNNTIDNLSTNSTGTVTGISNSGATNSHIIYLNSISALSSTSGIVAGIINSGGTTVNLHDNTINTLSSTTGGAVNGISISAGATVNTYNNKIYNLTSGTTVGTAYGISVTGGTTNTVYNNMVSDLRTQQANTVNAINGLYLNGGTTIYAYYNSVYLSAATLSSGNPFGTSGIYTSTASTITLKNNLVVNNAIASGTGVAVAHRRSAASVTGLTADYNSYFANLIGYDGTTSYSTLVLYQAWATTESHSISVDPGFNAGALTNLHQANMANANLIQLKGTPIAGISSDIDAQGRNATTPDIGYDEVNTTTLPIDLLSFTGTAQGSSNLLEWSTATEVNNDYFTLERGAPSSSPEGGEWYWTKIGTVKGAGNSSITLNYNFSDKLTTNNQQQTTFYYRLKQTDFNGDYKYSTVISLPVNNEQQTTNNLQLTTIYPNPATDNFNFTINSTTETVISVNVVDLLGRVAIGLESLVVSGENNLKMDVSMLSKGSYFLQVITKDGLNKMQKQLIVK